MRTPDAPAHGGRRAEPAHTIDWDDQLAEAVEHAEELAAATGAPAVVGGHSMGSAVELGLAATRPDLAAGLWLEDPPFADGMTADDERRPDAAAHLDEFRRWFADLQSIPFEQVVAAARADHPDWEPTEYGPWARAKQSVDVAGFERPVPWVGAGWAARARAVRCPVVVAAGQIQRGGLLSAAAESDLAALPSWQIHRIPAGHDVRRDAPRATAALLAGLIRSVGG